MEERWYCCCICRWNLWTRVPHDEAQDKGNQKGWVLVPQNKESVPDCLIVCSLPLHFPTLYCPRSLLLTPVHIFPFYTSVVMSHRKNCLQLLDLENFTLQFCWKLIEMAVFHTDKMTECSATLKFALLMAKTCSSCEIRLPQIKLQWLYAMNSRLLKWSPTPVTFDVVAQACSLSQAVHTLCCVFVNSQTLITEMYMCNVSQKITAAPRKELWSGKKTKVDYLKNRRIECRGPQ